MKNIPGLFRFLTVLLVAMAMAARAQNILNWTGGSAGTTNGWSVAGNWTNTSFASASYVPPYSNIVQFAYAVATSPTNAANIVDNVVDMDYTIKGVSFVELLGQPHTTFINPGVTLTITNVSAVAANLIGMGNVVTNNAVQVNWTIIGTNGARFVVGNPSAPDALHQVVISERFNSTTPFTQRGTLDLSGLDNFVFGGGIFQVAANPSTGKDWPRGRVILARTNLIIAISSTTPAIKVGQLAGNGTGGDGDLQLGQTNAIFTYSIRVGGNRASTGTMQFQSGLNNPTLFLRGTDGVSPVVTMGIGDSIDSGANVNATGTGIVDLTAGTVDALVSDLFVGRNLSNVANSTGHGNGTLTWVLGTIEVSSLNIGSQGADNRGNATGVVNVRTNALLKVNSVLNIGGDAGTRSGTGNGTLNVVHGGVVSVLGDIVENNVGANGTSRINVTNGYLTTAGAITVDTLNVYSGVVSNTGLATVLNLSGAGVISGPVAVSNLLSPGNSIGTLTIYNDLNLSAGSTNVFEVNIDTLAHDMVVGINNLTYGGTLVISPSGLGTAITNESSVKLFDAQTYTGSFSSIVPTIPATGFRWVTTGLTNGILAIAAVNTTPTNLFFALTGNALDISWPADRLGWSLQSQTNPVSVGISNNWFTVPGSAGTNHVIMPVDSLNGAVFYRLIYP